MPTKTFNTCHAGARVSVRSIGCRTNQEEISALAAELRSAGFPVTDDIENADIVIVNTCSVTSHTEAKTRRVIRSVSRDNPSAKILVTGCFAQRHGEALLDNPGVKWVVGNGDKRRIAEIISSRSGGAYLSAAADVFGDPVIPDPEESDRTRFSVKIQEGCDYRCAYCVVPSLRGPSRSAPRDRLIDIFKSSIDKGYKEIVLTGTHIGQYRDADNYNLESLLADFLKVGGDYRIRLSSLDPRDLTETLAAVVGEDSRVCDHLHVSVQSLNADVLASMGRGGGGLDKLIDRLRGFRAKYPLAGLGADFIAGHPGETDAMFEETLRAVESIGFTYGHVFRYSKREGTRSSLMGGQISESVKTSRADALRSALQKNRDFFLSLQLPSPIRIIIESDFPIRGVSGNYIKVEIPSARAQKNMWMRAVLTGEVRGGYCIGNEIIS